VAHQASHRSQHSGRGARHDLTGLGRTLEETAKTSAVIRVNSHDKTFETNHSAEHRRYTVGQRLIIERKTSRRVIRGVDHDIDILEESRDVGLIDSRHLSLKLELRKALLKSLPSNLYLQAADIAGSIQDLTLKVRQLHPIIVYETNRADAGLSEAKEHRAAQASRPYDERACMCSIGHKTDP